MSTCHVWEAKLMGLCKCTCPLGQTENLGPRLDTYLVQTHPHLLQLNTLFFLSPRKPQSPCCSFPHRLRFAHGITSHHKPWYPGGQGECGRSSQPSHTLSPSVPERRPLGVSRRSKAGQPQSICKFSATDGRCISRANVAPNQSDRFPIGGRTR